MARTPPAPVEPDPVRVAYLNYLADEVHKITHRLETRNAIRDAGGVLPPHLRDAAPPTWAQWQAEHTPSEES